MYLPLLIGSNTYHICGTTMADDLIIKNVYHAYLENTPYVYPKETEDHISISTDHQLITGWHILPTYLWCHFCTPKDWLNLTINYEAYHVHSTKLTLFNPVPITEQLAIGGEQVFTAFNNCLYCVVYTDKLYETQPYLWRDPQRVDDNPPLNYREGLQYKDCTDQKHRYVFPKYAWRWNNVRTQIGSTWAMSPREDYGEAVWPMAGPPTGCFWDPWNQPEEIQELRPGKNAVSVGWECHPEDENKWFNIDAVAMLYPRVPSGPYFMNRPGTNFLSATGDPDRIGTYFQTSLPTRDYSLPNWCYQPLVPDAWFWKELQQSIITHPGGNYNTKPDLYYPGTEWEHFKYPPTNSFAKLIPIFNSSNLNVPTSCLVSVQTALHLKVKKRRSAMFAPSWGPVPWSAFYAARRYNWNFFPPVSRYRTAGGRRTWQNIAPTDAELQRPQDTNAAAHPRETPYKPAPPSHEAGPGIGGTYSISEDQETNKPQLNITVLPISSDRIVQFSGTRPKRPITKDSPLYPPLDAAFPHIGHTNI